ncbi:tet methylcytosine dioxygenase-like isoform X2 [Mycetomoellerius zeteki]|uniref:tet methylcytosine dioxygenase-like isoform X2 n=1 Tax=Mycetomoellerius zeteki TaxID=64791 RepID=UPI00084E6C18|nr:PREDICTED: DNA N6-methyl adenine demethylase isoform X2 [Trachymyrmex zeteki]
MSAEVTKEVVATERVPTSPPAAVATSPGTIGTGDLTARHLPPFSSFAGDNTMDTSTLPPLHPQDVGSNLIGWDYYEGLTGRLIDVVPTSQYRPWESKGGGPEGLPSFASQFTAPSESEPQLTALTPLSPASISHSPPVTSAVGLPSFHTLGAPLPTPHSHRGSVGYPLVPAPVAARDVPSLQQQMIDERHIQLLGSSPVQAFPPPPPGHPHHTVLTVVKPEYAQLHHANFQNPISTVLDSSPTSRPIGIDGRKKERRKIRAGSMESEDGGGGGGGGGGAGTGNVESSGQVAAVSSTANRGVHHLGGGITDGDGDGGLGDKPAKKKRKRCGECIGCQRKDNCGDCAPCRNDKSHQICKMRRCEKLTEKKHLYHLQTGEGAFRERGRGRGKGATRNYRKIARQVSTPDSAPAGLGSPQGGIGGLQQQHQQQTQQSLHQPDPMQQTKDNLNPAANQQTGALRNGNPPPPVVSMSPGVMPFYGDSGAGFRPTAGFGNTVWHQGVGPVGTVAVETSPAPWPPQQFIQQIPAPNQLEELRYHPQYAGATPYHPQTVPYQQQTFITADQSAFQRAGTTGQYTITGQPSPLTPVVGQTVVSTPQRQLNGQFVDPSATTNQSVAYERQDYVNGYQQQDVTMAPPPSTTPTSRSSSVHMDSQQQQPQGGPQQSSQQQQQQQQQQTAADTQVKGFATIASTNVSGNEMPGYPLQPDPQSLHNSNGYPGYVEMGQQSTQSQWQMVSQQQQQHHQQTQMQQQSVVDNNQQHVWSDTSGKMSSSVNSNLNWQEGAMQQSQKPPSQQQQQNMQSNMKSQVEQQQTTQMQPQELPRPASHMSWETGSVKEPQTPQSWSENADNQQQQTQGNWSQQSPKLRDPQNSRLTPSSQQPSQHQTWLQHSPKLSDHQHSNAQQNARMTPSAQRSWQQNSPEMQGSQNPRLTPSGQQMQQQQWPQQTKVEQNPRLTPSNQISWPDTPTSQPNWSPNSIKSDNSQQPQQQWQDSQPSPRRTPSHQWQNQLPQENKLDSQMSWSPVNSVSETQPIWGQQATKQDMQNSGERIAWQQQTVDTSKPNGFPENQDNPESHVYVQSNRVNLNSRLKSMILNKQQQQQQQQQQIQQQQQTHQHHQMQSQHTNTNNGSTSEYPTDDQIRDAHESNEKMQEKRTDHFINQSNIISMTQSNENLTGNFLLHSHHPRVENLPDGGGLWEWTEGEHNHNNNDIDNKDDNTALPENGMTVFENFMKLTAENKSQSYDKDEDQHSWEAEGRNDKDQEIDDKSFQQRLCMDQIENTSFEKSQKISENDGIKTDNLNFLKTNAADHMSFQDKCDSDRLIKQEVIEEHNYVHVSHDASNIVENEENQEITRDYKFRGDGGPAKVSPCTGSWCCRRGGTEQPTPEHLRDGCCQGLQTKDEILDDSTEKAELKNEGPHSPRTPTTTTVTTKLQDHLDKLKNNVRTEVPDCNCFPADKCPPEPGSYYTHLGAAASLPDLRNDLERRTGLKGDAIRFEKVVYTGKEGKTTQGCPMAKWIIRRSGIDEKILTVVKHRQGHKCPTAWIVVAMVAWEGVPTHEADRIYTLLSHKLNRFGLPTTRRCGTNEPRTCACQGLDPDTCGASFSFGCSWSMYYNGCKYARSKTVRKFRLSVRSEEQEVEERMHVLATLLSPLYLSLAPEAFNNQTQFEREASECRLGFKPGRPFSGVTACIDFCAHSHRDLHNMNNGCTVVVTLTKHRTLSKPEDEQLHVLPLYIMDDTDEFGSKEGQEKKVRSGALEFLSKYPCEVRVRSVPLQPCRRHGKKRKEEESDIQSSKKDSVKIMTEKIADSGRSGHVDFSKLQSQLTLEMTPMFEGIDAQLQSSQVSSTVLDSPVSMYQGWGAYQGEQQWNRNGWLEQRNWLNSWGEYSSFGGLERDIKVDPDSTSLDDTRPRSTVSQEEHRPGSRNLPNSTVDSARGCYGSSPRIHPVSPRSHISGEVSYNASPRGCTTTSQDPKMASLKGLEHSNMENNYNHQMASGIYAASVNGQNDCSPSKFGSLNPSFGMEMTHRNIPSKMNQSPVHKYPDTMTQNYMDAENSTKSPLLRPQVEQTFANRMQHLSPSKQMQSSVNSGYHNQYYDGNTSNLYSYMENSNHKSMETPNSNVLGHNSLHLPEQRNDAQCLSNDQRKSIYHAQRQSEAKSFVSNHPPSPSSDQVSCPQNWNMANSWCSNQVKNPHQFDQQMGDKKIWVGKLTRSDQTKTAWETSSEPSPFRVPRGRPPSRTISNQNLSAEPNAYPNPLARTFLKPPDSKPIFPDASSSNTAQNGCISNHLKDNCTEDKLREGFYDNKQEVSNSNSLAWTDEVKQDLHAMSGLNHHAFPQYGYPPYPVFEKPYTNSWEGYNYNHNQSYQTPEQFYQQPKREGCFHSSQYPYQGLNPTYQGLNSGWTRWDTPRWDIYGPAPYFPVLPEPPPKAEPLGEITDYSENEECFKDPQMGGVAIALSHGSVLFECAKHEMHATTALRKPNRLNPTRISLVFYQHRNLNRPKHGWDEWEEKMRLRKLGITTSTSNASVSTTNPSTPTTATSPGSTTNEKTMPLPPLSHIPNVPSSQFMMRSPTYTTMTWTTLFPMHPCMITGPYQEGGAIG